MFWHSEILKYLERTIFPKFFFFFFFFFFLSDIRQIYYVYINVIINGNMKPKLHIKLICVIGVHDSTMTSIGVNIEKIILF